MEAEFTYFTSLSIRFDLSDSEILRTVYQNMFNWIYWIIADKIQILFVYFKVYTFSSSPPLHFFSKPTPISLVNSFPLMELWYSEHIFVVNSSVSHSSCLFHKRKAWIIVISKDLIHFTFSLSIFPVYIMCRLIEHFYQVGYVTETWRGHMAIFHLCDTMMENMLIIRVAFGRLLLDKENM